MSVDDAIVDAAALRERLAADLGTPSSFSVAPLGGGNANETLHVEWGERDLVVRRPPLDEPAPDILHDLLREYAVLDALADTWVPTPDVLFACEDESVLGSEFYVMERLPGDVVDDDPPERFQTRAHRRAVGAETVDTLAKIHDVDVDRVGLGSLGDPDGYTDRLVSRLTDQLSWATDRTADRRELPVLWEVADWLADHVPPMRHRALVHGDYKPDNLLFAPGTPPRINGVLDWEMAGRGDPLVDVGWLLSYWTEARDPSPVTDDVRDRYADHDAFPMLEVYAESYSKFMRHEDFHTRRELLDRYEAQTGVTYADDRFYRALGVFKLAVLCEGFFRTFLEGSPSAKESYPLMELLVPTLGRQARQVIDGETPL
ncbi:MAG: phosphotransferase family protein [Haloarculaceae archaeon]